MWDIVPEELVFMKIGGRELSTLGCFPDHILQKVLKTTVTIVIK